jgi:adenylate cyclase class 1
VVALAIVNLGVDPLARLAKRGLLLTTTRSDPVCFGSARACLAQSLDYAVQTSWGELYARRFDGTDGLFDGLCQHLALAWPGDGEGATLHCHAAGGSRAGLVARRVEALAARLLECFRTEGEGARCLVAAGTGHYLLERDGDRFRWRHADDERALLELLAEPLATPRPVVLERGALAGSRLGAILQSPPRGGFQVYSLSDGGALELYVLDEYGALFHQVMAGTDELHALVHLRRFLESLGRRRSAQSPAAARRWLEGGVRFHRLVRRGAGWQAVTTAVDAGTGHLELTLLVDPPGGGFRLRCGDAEFCSRALGDRIYVDVVREVLAHRQGAAAYPVYLTGVASAGLPDPGGSRPMAILALKRRIEGRLNGALRGLAG